MAVIVTLLLIAMATAVVFVLGSLFVGQPASTDSNKFNRLDEIKVGLAVVAGLGAAVGLTVSYRRQRVTEDDSFTQRFGAAADQLGHDKPAVRLAGVYAMARLGDDWERQRQTCIDVLCAYFRMPYEPPAQSASEPAPAKQGEKPGTVVQGESASTPQQGEEQVRETIIRVIRDRLRPYAAVSWSSHNLDFTGATFRDGDFDGAVFSGGDVSFNKANFSAGNVVFSSAIFSGGNVSFDGASFSDGNVSFLTATFSGGSVTFNGATFSGGNVSFHFATFSGGNVTFNGANFNGGNVSFHFATFSGDFVTFDRATFSGGNVSFQFVTFSGGNVTFYERDLRRRPV